MANGSNLTTSAAYLKRTFAPAVILNTIASESDKFLNLITHAEDGSGSEYAFTMQVGPNPSGSADFATAQSKGTLKASQAGQFVVPFYDDNAVPSVSGKMIRRSKNKQGAWLEQLKTEVQSSLSYMNHRLAIALFTSGFGELATVASPGASTTLTLSDKSKIYRFVPGMDVVSSPAVATGALSNSGTSLTVVSVNYSAGTMVMSANVNTMAVSDGDWLFTKGDRQDASSPTRLRPPGLGYWATTTAPSDTTYGPDRSTNSFYNAWIIDNTVDGYQLSQSIQKAVQFVVGVGNVTKPVCVLSMKNFTDLSAQLQGQALYGQSVAGGAQMTGRGNIGFKAMSVMYDGVECAIIVSKICDDQRVYVGDPKVIVHKSCGQAPGLDSSIDDGGLVRQASDDGIEARLVSTETIIVNCPSKLAVIKLA
jgi:hypothetical protein